MLSLLRRVSGDEAQDSGATSQAPPEKRLVPQLALDKLNAVTAKGGGGTTGDATSPGAERQAAPKSPGERPPPPQKSAAAPEIGGIHASLKFTGTGPLMVDKVWPGGPAAKSKMVHVGDLLLEVDGHDVTTRSVKEAQELIIGPAGTSVELKVHQPSKKYPHTVSVVREPRGSEPSRAVSARVRSKSPHKTPKSKKEDLEQAKADLRRSLPVLDSAGKKGMTEAGSREGDAMKSPSRSAKTGSRKKKNREQADKDQAGQKRERKAAEAAGDLPPTQASLRVPKPSTREPLSHPAIVDTDQRAIDLKKSPRGFREGYGAGGMSPRDIDMRPYHSLNKAPGHLIESLERDELSAEVERLKEQLRNAGGAGGDARQALRSESAAHVVLLDGRVRRLQQQLDAKSSAHTASVARISALETENLALKQRLRLARRGGPDTHAADADPEHTEAERAHELQQLQESLRMCKAAAERSAGAAERERAARQALEDDLKVLTDAGAAALPAGLMQRMATLEVELARERRARSEAEVQMDSITVSMASEIEEMSSSRSNALAEVKTCQARVLLMQQHVRSEEARRAHAEDVLRRLAKSSAGKQGVELNRALTYAREELTRIEQQMRAEQQCNDEIKAAAEQELAEMLAQIERLRSDGEKAAQQLVQMQEEVEDEAAARFRAEDALQALRAAVQVWMEISCAGLYT